MKIKAFLLTIILVSIFGDSNASEVTKYERLQVPLSRVTAEKMEYAESLDIEYMYNYKYNDEKDLVDCYNFLYKTFLRSSHTSNKNKLPLKLKVATYNIGHFNQGRLGGLQGEGKFVRAELNNWKRWIGEQNLDIIAVEEWNRYFDKDSTFVSEDEILKPFYNNVYWGKETRWIHNGIATNYKLENIHQVDWHGDYYAVIGDLIINGTVIKVISTHIPWQKDWHEDSFNSLVELLGRYEYFICMGDMNASDTTQKKFLEAGFNMANGGALGWFTTAQASVTADDYRGGINYNIDNIITSNNIKIFNVRAPKTRLNDLDHLPVIADLVITW